MYKEQMPEEVLERQKQNEKLVILDVREPEEWQFGHIPVAKHIPLGQIARALNELDPKQETIIVCRSGNRSGQACDFLSSMGFNVVNMLGGMSKWTGDTVYGA
ncbi:rhodanese-like domain-containing protein [Paenibacillus vulneris]|uniref:Rhodanese-like domain-containing protein n=1 Tax=Paenibacillus vulneris TaxID=1133364 RepID=A0ABW3UTT7_9BACL